MSLMDNFQDLNFRFHITLASDIFENILFQNMEDSKSATKKLL